MGTDVRAWTGSRGIATGHTAVCPYKFAMSDTRLSLYAGTNVRAMLAAIVASETAASRRVVAGPATTRQFGALVAELTNGRRITPQAGGALLRRDRFVAVDLAGRGARLDRVWLTRELVT